MKKHSFLLIFCMVLNISSLGADLTGPVSGFASYTGSLTFTFTTVQNTMTTGLWHAFVIGPDQTIAYGPLVDITADNTIFTIIIGPSILIGPYSIVLYNDTISDLNTNVVSSIVVSTSFNNSMTAYSSFVILNDIGVNQHFHYNPFIFPLSGQITIR